MEEKVLIKSERYNLRKFFTIILVIMTLIAIISPFFALRFAQYRGNSMWDIAKRNYETAHELHQKNKNWQCGFILLYESDCCGWYVSDAFIRQPVPGRLSTPNCPTEYSSLAEYALPFCAAIFLGERQHWYIIGGYILFLIILLVVIFWLKSYELILTDKRVYGRAAFGKRIDLPIDSVSAVGTMWLKGISVSTSSGKIGFLLIKNRDEIHKRVSEMLISRQPAKTAPVVIYQAPQSSADELIKYKELLDSGVITQEEFDAKKKHLLGL